jgi:hypothetical protein
MVKGLVFPGPKMDFVEPWVQVDGCLGADLTGSFSAPVQAAGKDPGKRYRGEPEVPEFCLADTGVIQGDLGLTDEPFFMASLNLAVAQEKNRRLITG